MRAYHKQFARIDRRTLDATRTLMRSWSTKSSDQKIADMATWLNTVSGVYRVNTPSLKITGSPSDYYVDSKIFLTEPSLITLFHEFRHHLQRRGVVTIAEANIEHDARGWSLSLYRLVAPRTFRRLATENRIIHLTPDLQNRVMR